MASSDARLRQVRLGIIGFGKLARDYYVPALRHLKDTKVTAVADPLPASRREAERRLGVISLYESCDELLAAAEAEAVLVASPPSTHLEIWRRVAARGLPVFMEKPLLVNNQSADLDDAGEAGRLLMVNFNRRFWPTYQQLMQRAANGGIGRLHRIELKLHVNVLPWCSVTPHRLAPAEGGALYDLGSQMIDLALALAGEPPTAVSAEAQSQTWERDHVHVRLRFAGGLEAHCDLAYAQRTREQVTVRGNRGGLRIDNPNMGLVVDAGQSVAKRLARRAAGACLLGWSAIRRDRSMLRYSIRQSIEAFVNSVRTGGAFWPGLDEAVRVARCLDAAVRSIETGQTVPLESVQAPAR